MPTRVHALLLVRAGPLAEPHLRRTLSALESQSHEIDHLTIVVSGSPSAALRALIETSGAEGVISASRGGFAEAMTLASRRLAPDAEAVWLLAQDTAPEPAALAQLAAALEVQSSLAIAAPKLVEWDDPARIVSLGESMSRFGRTVGLADGEHDQGQHDADADVLGADVRALLVRREAWDALGGLDAGLGGADEGLDLAVRARLRGDRVAVVPAARVAVAGDGVAGLARGRRSYYPRRVARLHRQLAYATPLRAAAFWLLLPLLALGNLGLALLRKQPGTIPADLAASARVFVQLPELTRARRRISRGGRAVPWSLLAPLRVDRRSLRSTLALDAIAAEPDLRGEVRFFSGGGAWVVLAATVVGVIAFFEVLTWPALGGGGLLPLRTTLASLWNDAGLGIRSLGLDVQGPADPFAAVVALLGSLTFWQPSQSMVVLWVLALPLAALGGWFGATRLTERAGLRATLAALWALAPPLIAALIEGRPAAVIAHLLLPWLLIALAAARRSLAAAGAASLLLAIVVACAPSLAPALAAIVLAFALAAGRGIARVVWVIVPTAALCAPLVWRRGVIEGDWLALAADPGASIAGKVAGADAPGRWSLLTGSPLPGPVGWDGLSLAPYAFVLVVPLAVLALAALVSPRLRSAASLLAVALSGFCTAVLAVGTSVNVAGDQLVPLWPGTALSLAWAGAAGAMVVGADAVRSPRLARVQALAVTVAALAVAVLAAPGLTAVWRGESVLTDGPRSTLPSYVSAVATEGEVGTIELTPLDSGVGARVVWGASDTLGGQTTLLSAPGLGPDSTGVPGSEPLAALAADLVTGGTTAGAPSLDDARVTFVLLRHADGSAAASARSLESQATAALDARGTLELVSDTPRGRLWKLAGDEALTREVPPRGAVELVVIGTQLGVFAVALLLALPTAASRREARRYPRVLGAPRTAAQRPLDDEPLAVSADEDAEEIR